MGDKDYSFLPASPKDLIHYCSVPTDPPPSSASGASFASTRVISTKQELLLASEYCISYQSRKGLQDPQTRIPRAKVSHIYLVEMLGTE